MHYQISDFGYLYCILDAKRISWGGGVEKREGEREREREREREMFCELRHISMYNRGETPKWDLIPLDSSSSV